MSDASPVMELSWDCGDRAYGRGRGFRYRAIYRRLRWHWRHRRQGGVHFPPDQWWSPGTLREKHLDIPPLREQSGGEMTVEEFECRLFDTWTPLATALDALHGDGAWGETEADALGDAIVAAVKAAREGYERERSAASGDGEEGDGGS